MKRWIPDRKVWAGGLVAMGAWLVVTAIEAASGNALDPGVRETIAALVGLGAQYLVPPSAQDILKRIDARMREAFKGTAPLILAGLFAVPLVLGACTFNPLDNQQVVAGVTDVEIAFTPEGGISHVRWRDGKEKDAVAVNTTLPGGVEFSYSASDVVAFDGQRIRGEVEKALARADAGPEVVDALVDAIKTAITGAP